MRAKRSNKNIVFAVVAATVGSHKSTKPLEIQTIAAFESQKIAKTIIKLVFLDFDGKTTFPHKTA